MHRIPTNSLSIASGTAGWSGKITNRSDLAPVNAIEPGHFGAGFWSARVDATQAFNPCFHHHPVEMQSHGCSGCSVAASSSVGPLCAHRNHAFSPRFALSCFLLESHISGATSILTEGACVLTVYLASPIIAMLTKMTIFTSGGHHVHHHQCRRRKSQLC